MTTNMVADRKWTDDTRRRVVEMYKAGAKLKAIAATEGVPISTIYNILKDADEAPHRMTRRKTTPTTQSAQVETLEWLTQRLFELQNEVARLKGVLSEYGIDPETGELLAADT